MSNFDLRIPIGLFFGLIGIAMAGYGMFGDQSLNVRSLGININLIWGGCLVLFGVGMLVFAKLNKADS